MKFNKKKAVWNGVSAGAGIAAEEVARNTIDYTRQAMDIIAREFEASGAENIEKLGANITNFTYGPEDIDGIELINKMDFSSVPQLYVSGGNLGFQTLLWAEIIGGILHGAAMYKFDNEHLKGAIKTGRRIGAGMGLGQLINANIGLSNMPYKMSSPSYFGGPYPLVEFSQRTDVSTSDIEPIVSQGITALTALTYAGIATILGVELGLEFLDYYKSKRAGIKSMTNSDFEKLEERTSY